MEVVDVLRQTGGIGSMARELGVSDSQAASGAAALIPALLGGFKKQAQTQPTGLQGLVGILSGLGGGGLLDEVLAPQPTNVSRGNEILGQIFGSKDVSRSVAENAAAQTGIDPTLLKKMLPVLAMLAAGYMAKQGSAPAASQTDSGGPSEAAGATPSTGSKAAAGSGVHALASMLDLNGDGNPLDDILGMVGKLVH